MREDWGNWNTWNWLTALGLLLAGLPLVAILLGAILRFAGLKRVSKACMFGGAGGYIGAATATFTSIGITLFTYIFHFWRFPEKGASPSTVMSISFAAVLIVIPVSGLLVGTLYGVWKAWRAKASET
jgi:hypothetical protein